MDEASGNRADSHGSNTLTDTNTVASGTGIISNGASFVRADTDSLRITDASQTGLDITGDLSLSFWVNASTLTNGTSYQIIQKWQTARSYLFRIDVTAGAVRNLLVGFSASGTSAGQTTGVKDLGTMNTGTFYHLVLVYTASAGTVTVYKDGSSLGDITSQNTSIANSSADFVIGSTDATSGLTGVVDEVGIWNRTLTSGEVTSLYNGGAGFAYPFVSTSVKDIISSGFIPFAR